MHQAVILVCRTVRVGVPVAPSVPSRRQEAEANAFSAALVMPGDALAEAVAELDAVRSATVRAGFPDAVARRFGVPPEAVAYRLVTLGLLAI